MKLLIVLGLFAIFGAESKSFYPGFPFFPPPNYDGQQYFNNNNNINNFGRSDLNSFNSNSDIRSMARELISTLRGLEDEPQAARSVKKLFSDKNSVCLSSLDEAIEAIEEGTRLVEAAEGDLRTLTSKVENLMGEEDEAEVVRDVASILRALEPLLTKISPANPSSKICAASPDSTMAYLRSLALMFHQLSEDAQDQQQRRMMAQSASTVSVVTAFLGQLRRDTRKFQNSCFPDKESGQAGIRALGNIITSLADMTAVLGKPREAEEIRKGNLITENIVAQIQTMKDLDIGFNTCKEGQDLSSAADTMEDLANIIEDVGIENLRKQLGINLAFDFE